MRDSKSAGNPEGVFECTGLSGSSCQNVYDPKIYNDCGALLSLDAVVSRDWGMREIQTMARSLQRSPLAPCSERLIGSNDMSGRWERVCGWMRCEGSRMACSHG